MITWVLYLCIGILIGGMAGFYFAKLDDFSKKQKQDLEEKLQKSEQELVEYKDQVTAHFIETANLINNMTESYQKVHEHLANGSVELCNNAVEVNKLTISSRQLLSSTSKSQTRVEGVASLSDRKAPKNLKHDNNNKNTDDIEAMMDTSELGTLDSTNAFSKVSAESDPDPATRAYRGTVAETGSSSTDNDKAVVAETMVPEPLVAASETMTSETMAVAVDDDSTAKSEEKTNEDSNDDAKSKRGLPGSRMVH